jgi:hypothetical protein
LQMQRQKLIEELNHFAADKDHKREAFDLANRILKEEKQKREEDEMKMYSLDRINYFPFTHGELIEKQRSILQEIIKSEQLQTINDRLVKKAKEARARKQAILNQQVNAQLLQQPIQHTPIVESTFVSPRSNLATNTNILAPKPHHMRVGDTPTNGMAEVMQEALSRHEKNIEKLDMLHKLQDQD